MDPLGSSYSDLVDHAAGMVAPAPLETGDNQRTLPRQLSAGALRGNQRVGYKDVVIDGSHNQIVIGTVTNSLGEQAQTVIGDLTPGSASDKSFGLRVSAADGTTVTYGLLSDGSPGMEVTDSAGFVLFKLDGHTWSWFDKLYGTNTMQAGQLPDGSYGWVTVPPSNNVADAFGA